MITDQIRPAVGVELIVSDQTTMVVMATASKEILQEQLIPWLLLILQHICLQ